jgi:RNA polymerase sigma factor (sigma-70 family)
MRSSNTDAEKRITPELLDKLYGFSYARCENADEAGELCSEIVFALLKSLRKAPEIGNLYAYIWRVARRVYADFCEKRRERSGRYVCGGDIEDRLYGPDPAEELAESAEEEALLSRVGREIAFLSKIYRDVTVMFYLDEKPMSEIAKALGISENTVKQRLFSARNTIRKAIENNMELKDKLPIKPIHMIYWGDGNPLAGEPQKNAYRTFSQCVLYLCKDTPKSGKEISEALNVPMLFVEEELELQSEGTNGSDGLLKKLDNGKYLSTFIMLDCSAYREIQALFEKYLDDYADRLQAYIERRKADFLAFPFLNKQDDVRFILWSQIKSLGSCIDRLLEKDVVSRFYPGLELEKKDYYVFGYVSHGGERYPEGYGMEGVEANNVCGYSRVYLCNISGKRKQAHFHCGLNVSTAPQIQLMLRAIDGLNAGTLSKSERETAAKAIENGYLKKEGEKLIPKVLIIPMDKLKDFYALAGGFRGEAKEFAEMLAEDYNKLVKKYLPAHLYGQLDEFIVQTMHDFITNLIEKCIERGILYAPENPVCAEGTFFAVEK